VPWRTRDARATRAYEHHARAPREHGRTRPSPVVASTTAATAMSHTRIPPHGGDQSQGPPTSVGDAELARQQIEHFGVPRNGDPLRLPYGAQKRAYEVFPEAWGNAYRGQPSANNFLRLVMLTKLAEKAEFITQRLLPIQVSDSGDTKYRITQIRYDAHELDDIPELGVPRLTLKSARTWERDAVRKGLAFFMEHGFAMTAVGIEHYNLSVMQIVNSTHETIFRNAFAEILTAVHVSQQIRYPYQHFSGLVRSQRIEDTIAFECAMFGALNRRPHAYLTMCDDAKRSLTQRAQTVPNFAIGPHGSRRLIGMHPAVTDFMRVGERGASAFGKDGGNFDMYGTGVEFHESPLFINYTEGAETSEDPLVRERMIGTFFLMDHPCKEMVKTNTYRSEFSDICVFDTDTDQMQRIRLADVIEHCTFTHDVDAKLQDGLTLAGYLDKVNGSTFATGGAEDKYKYWTKDEVAAMAASGSLKGAAEYCLKNNLVQPCNYLIARPRERWMMGSMVFTRGGGELGFVHVGNSNFQTQHDGVRKFLIGTFTVYVGVIIARPELIYIAPNVMYVQYVAGGGVKFFKPSETDALHQLDENDDNIDGQASLIVCPYPLHEHITKPHLSLVGGWTGSNDPNPHFSTAKEFASHWNLNGATAATFIQDRFFEDAIPIQDRVAQGHQLMYMWTGEKAIPNGQQREGTGHHGPQTYAGIRATREGRGALPYVMESTPYSSLPRYLTSVVSA